MTVLTKFTGTSWRFEISFFFFLKIEIFIYMGPYGGGGEKISKCYFSCSYDSVSTQLFLNVPCDSSHKSCLNWNFEFKFKKERLKFIIVANGKKENCQYLGRG